MSRYEVDDVLKFLTELKSRKQIMEKFSLSNSESWHLVRWLEKANLIECIRTPIGGFPNRIKLYRTLKDKKKSK